MRTNVLSDVVTSTRDSLSRAQKKHNGNLDDFRRANQFDF